MAKSTPTIDFSRHVSLTEVAESSGFGPNSFRGYIKSAAYTLHRLLPKDVKPDTDASYYVAFWAQFHVTEVLDSDSGWDADEHDSTYDYYWKLGSKSLRYLFPSNDGVNPAGVEKDGSPLTFDALDLMAAGRVESGGLVTFDGEPDSLHGRWLFSRPGVPDNRSKIESKSGFYLAMIDSIPAVEAVDPSLIITTTDKKGKEVKAFDIMAIGPDGLPLGAKFWEGLNGVWDIKSITGTMKDSKTGKDTAFTQKYLFLTSYDGRVEAEEESEMPAPATKKATPTTTKKTTPPPADESNSDESLDDKITRLITSNLPAKGSVARQVLGLKVVRDSGEFPAKESAAAMVAYNKIVTEAPDKAMAKELADADMAPAFTYDPNNQKVERFTA